MRGGETQGEHGEAIITAAPVRACVRACRPVRQLLVLLDDGQRRVGVGDRPRPRARVAIRAAARQLRQHDQRRLRRRLALVSGGGAAPQ